MAYVIDKEHPHLGGNINGGDKGTFYPALWEWLVERYSIKTVLDVGCAEGHAMEQFSKLGCFVLGIDGLSQNIAKCKQFTKVHDLTKSPFLCEKVDLVWCCEVVEHIEEKFVDNVIKTLSNGKYIAMTCALPKQRGYHHVNCQPCSYWVNLLGKDYLFLENDSRLSREKFKDCLYWSRSGMIFKSIN